MRLIRRMTPVERCGAGDDVHAVCAPIGQVCHVSAR
jgi:hypothetical protein